MGNSESNLSSDEESGAASASASGRKNGSSEEQRMTSSSTSRTIKREEGDGQEKTTPIKKDGENVDESVVHVGGELKKSRSAIRFQSLPPIVDNDVILRANIPSTPLVPVINYI